MGIDAQTISSLAMVEGGADRTFARMDQAGITVTQVYQGAQQQKPVAPVAKSKPPMVDYANC